MRKPFLHHSSWGGKGSYAEDEQGNVYLVLEVKYKGIGDYTPVLKMQNVKTGKIENVSQNRYLTEFYPTEGGAQ